jgi:hypothetical protein
VRVTDLLPTHPDIGTRMGSPDNPGESRRQLNLKSEEKDRSQGDQRRSGLQRRYRQDLGACGSHLIEK